MLFTGERELNRELLSAGRRGIASRCERNRRTVHVHRLRPQDDDYLGMRAMKCLDPQDTALDPRSPRRGEFLSGIA